MPNKINRRDLLMTGLAAGLASGLMTSPSAFVARRQLLRKGIHDQAPDLLASQEARCHGKRDQVRHMLNGDVWVES